MRVTNGKDRMVNDNKWRWDTKMETAYPLATYYQVSLYFMFQVETARQRNKLPNTFLDMP